MSENGLHARGMLVSTTLCLLCLNGIAQGCRSAHPYRLLH